MSKKIFIKKVIWLTHPKDLSNIYFNLTILAFAIGSLFGYLSNNIIFTIILLCFGIAVNIIYFIILFVDKTVWYEEVTK